MRWLSDERKCLSLVKKVEIIKCVEDNAEEKRGIAKTFLIPRSTISTKLKGRKKIIEIFEKVSVSSSFKRIPTVRYADVEEVLL